MTTLSSSTPYQPPATRQERWRADLIDGVLFMGIFLLSAFVRNAVGGEDSPKEIWQFASILIVFGIQAHFLLRTGQTVGKKIMRLRVVMAETGEHPSWEHLLLLRPLGIVIGVIPLVGQIINLVDRFLLYHDERRTVEDRISGTKIVSIPID